MNYKIVNENHKFAVREVKTDQNLEVFKTKDDARKFMRHLNLGGSFDGWTPAFVARKVKTK